MCTKFIPPDPRLLSELFSNADIPDYNNNRPVSPTNYAPILLNKPNEQPVWRMARFGISVQFGDKQSLLLNARSETVTEKPTFKKLYSNQRCIVPAQQFFEWQKVNGKSIPYLFSQTNQQPFLLYGLWKVIQQEDDKVLSFVILTTVPNSVVKPIHSRMPLTAHNNQWLDYSQHDLEPVEEANYIAELYKPNEQPKQPGFIFGDGT